MATARHFIDFVPDLPIANIFGNAKSRWTRIISPVWRHLLPAVARDRKIEAERIVAECANDCWTDRVERDVADVYYSSFHPTPRGWNG